MRRRIVKNIKSLLIFLLVMPVAFIYRFFLSEPIWIVTERPNQARDNGFVFFQFMKREHADKKVYYVIDKRSKDYRKVEGYGAIIDFDSIAHYFFYCAAEIHISAHVEGCFPSEAVICRYLKRLLGIKDIFVPHGVSYGISDFCLKEYANLDLYVCSGYLEYQNVLENYGYRYDEVVYTGFPRLDIWNLPDYKVKKQIVVMPTWRRYIAQDDSVDFRQTQYYREYQEFLMSEELSKLLFAEGVTLIFYLHHNMQKYCNDFYTQSPNIKIVYDEAEYDIQELLIESAVLITDYSSVHFDFAYMKKPLIYFRFDEEEFEERQYEKSSFDVLKNGFGSVVYNVCDLIKEIKHICDENYQQSEFYYKRMREFYKLYDHRNCERVYNAIVEHFAN